MQAIFKNYLHYFIVSLVAVSLGGFLVFAQSWTNPTASPPGGNAPAPLREPLSSLTVTNTFNVKTGSQLVGYTYEQIGGAIYPDYYSPKCPCDYSSYSDCGGSFDSSVDLGPVCYDKQDRQSSYGYSRNSGNYSAPVELFNISGSVFNVTGNITGGGLWVSSLGTSGGAALAVSGGNVGIGATDPAYKLDVRGQIRATVGAPIYSIPNYCELSGALTLNSTCQTRTCPNGHKFNCAGSCKSNSIPDTCPTALQGRLVAP